MGRVRHASVATSASGRRRVLAGYARGVEAIAIGVAIAVISAAIITTARWFASAENRATAKQRTREQVCSHEWEGMPDGLMSPDSDWCRKCGARR
jgi:hypothetical protein